MSKGHLIRISDHLITIPDYKRARKEDIININEKPQNAFWRRQEDIPRLFYDYNPVTKINQSHTIYDQDGILISLSEEDTKLVQRFLAREVYRRKFGVHMKNGDQIIWLHPDYYYTLQWAKMQGLAAGFGAFRWFQNDFCIVRGHGIASPSIAGMFTAKPKKTGITQIMAGAYLNEATLTSNVEFHMMSKTSDDVTDVNMAMLFYIYDNLPYILKPKEKKRNEMELLFGNPVARSARSAKGQLQQFKDSQNKVLNTRIKAGPTKESGFDGPLVYRGWVDEYPKVWEASRVSPDKLYKKTIETVKQQQHIYGFLDYTSYVVEVDDKGFDESRKVWLDSELNTVHPETGRTKSNMITHMISVLDAMEGMYDVYGRTDRKKTLHLVNLELASKTENSEKLRLKRQYPKDKADAWGVGGVTSTFDNIRLGDLFTSLEAEARTGVRPWKEGRYRWLKEEWENGVPRPEGMFCPVYFEPLSDEDYELQREGRLKVFTEIPYEYQNEALLKDYRHEDDDKLAPMPHCPFVGAFDPTDYLLKREVKEGSKNAGHTFALVDAKLDALIGRTGSNIFFDEYFFRPDDPDEAYEDLVKSIIFSGKRVIVEANKPWVVTKLLKEGLHHFLLLRKPDGTIAPYKPGDEQTLTYTTDKIIEAYCRQIALYFTAPKLASTPDYAKWYKSMKGLEQLMKFDPTDTKKYDIGVSVGLTLLAAQAFSVFREEYLAKGGMYDQETLKGTVEGLLNF